MLMVDVLMVVGYQDEMAAQVAGRQPSGIIQAAWALLVKDITEVSQHLYGILIQDLIMTGMLVNPHTGKLVAVVVRAPRLLLQLPQILRNLHGVKMSLVVAGLMAIHGIKRQQCLRTPLVLAVLAV